MYTDVFTSLEGKIVKFPYCIPEYRYWPDDDKDSVYFYTQNLRKVFGWCRCKMQNMSYRYNGVDADDLYDDWYYIGVEFYYANPIFLKYEDFVRLLENRDEEKYPIVKEFLPWLKKTYIEIKEGLHNGDVPFTHEDEIISDDYDSDESSTEYDDSSTENDESSTEYDDDSNTISNSDEEISNESDC